MSFSYTELFDIGDRLIGRLNLRKRELEEFIKAENYTGQSVNRILIDELEYILTGETKSNKVSTL